MKYQLLQALLFVTTLSLANVSQMLAADETAEDRWAEEIARFAEQDVTHPTPEGGVVFVGSSSIRLWNLSKSFPGMEPSPLNRGFGGSQLEDSIRHVETLVLKHKPRFVVIYAGDNDIADGKDAERVEKDFVALTNRICENLPKAKVAYIAIKPSLARWQLANTMQEANQRIAKLCKETKELTFVDIWQPMLGDDGKPRPELFLKDGLHLNEKGYELWASLVTPLLAGDVQ